MAINFDIYSNSSGKTQTITLDFFADIVSDTSTGPTTEVSYYFKFTTGSRDTSNLTYSPRIIKNLSDLALNHAYQSAACDANAYSNVKSMVVDYIYDYIYGHTANACGSAVTYKAPMKFT